ncbi:Fe(II)/alpha-ketoglutarate-dependent arginine beta-hydroxylase [Saccharothrix tamanrassetensis]|uniref:Fe(II)/alpha-ketoglutarate-dependent arginine beta-hydroxylase n=1 Tax=Saccharothrix tamanrassetensis TaxID=1051531 RepID=A0A841CPM0_9PSEU|nr:arginine beta-hydroxylase, Fe(II)/alpha-ketoglutarate-dependent [Saccharothrix tamanrassetensis]MBB5959621.1 Fe(II)/alpha-ketoglutarate-dependent arginine beta-hydroxylase [Saccharothrix tamanrassetensis]
MRSSSAEASDEVAILTPAEAKAAAELATSLAQRYSSVDDEDLLCDLPFHASKLPLRAQRFLRRFALADRRGFCIVKGHVMDAARIGPTPADWRGMARPGPEFPEEILLLLYAALLGEPFGWVTQQDGHLVHNTFPIKEHEYEQLGSGSRELLTWHTEDAFHPYRGDYLILASLRNPDRVATTVAELDVSALSPEDLGLLFQERFRIVPDESHRPGNNSSVSASDRRRFANIERLTTDHRPVAVLFGSPTDPYLRLDPYFMEIPEEDLDANRAFRALVEVIDRNLRNIVLEQGDFLFVNNHRAVHGRAPFTARYDGTDRWLKRVNVTTDLRKSRDMRATAASRLIG